MIKATLSCPHEQVFICNNLMDVPVVPGNRQRPGARISNIEVNVLEVFGEQALVLLPNIMSNAGETAMVDIMYLNEWLQ